MSVSPQGVTTRNAQPEARPALSGKPFLARFTDIAAEAGLDMRLVMGNDSVKKYIVEANGTGVSVIDFDSDGWMDLLLVNGSQLEPVAGEAPYTHLYRNERNGRFRDVSRQAGVARAGWGSGVCSGDIDNDGFPDLYLTYWGPNVLFRNTGKGTFEDATAQAGVAGTAKGWSSGCTFFDYDRDGKLDLLVTSYQAFDLKTAPLPGKSSNCEWKGMPVFCGPRGLPFGSATLYHNRGDGTFEDVSAKAGIRDVSDYYAFTAVAADLNGDGWPDIYIACDSTPSILFRNNRDGTFADIATETGVAFSEHGFEQGGMGIAVGDFDNDGLPDLVKTNFAGDFPNLYRNLGKGIFEDVVLRAGLAVNPQVVGWGVGLEDLDHDGWRDILQVNGHVYPELDRKPGNERYKQPRIVYRNLGGGRFEDVSALAGPAIGALHSSRGAAFSDFDNDGDLDVIVMNMGEKPSLLRNDLKSADHWTSLLLEGRASNRSAIGAAVWVEAGGLRRYAAALGQSSFLSQNDPRLNIGLGSSDRVEKIVVRWPNGNEESFPGAPAGKLLRLVEGSSKTEVR